ncbi:hypothetical protein CPAV1605_1518 [seawater metagenome]|uniref:SET domain-containing protein n=1 Tax=seawater metagenome TaxID=1561972 RepID=A0A5E8CMD5_9ZZZZ
MLVPDNWPKDIKYSNTISKESQKHLQSLEGVELKEIQDYNHILRGEIGLFAKRDWQPFEVIGGYCGILKKDIGGKYVAFAYYNKKGDKWCIDAELEGNETRFINDYRNIKSYPNVMFQKTNVNNKRVILIIVIKEIKEGDEILSDYGETYWENI